MSLSFLRSRGDKLFLAGQETDDGFFFINGEKNPSRYISLSTIPENPKEICPVISEIFCRKKGENNKKKNPLHSLFKPDLTKTKLIPVK